MSSPSDNQVFLYNSSGTFEASFTGTTAIQDAITAAGLDAPGDTIQIGSGNYAEDVTVNVSGLTIENAPGAKVTIVGQGGDVGALTIGTGVSGVTIKSSDGLPGNFIVEGASTGQEAALYLQGKNGGIKVNGITVQAAATGGQYAVLSGDEQSNILFQNNVFTGAATSQLVDIQGSQVFGDQNGNVNFNGNTFSGSTNGSLLDLTAPGEIINNTFSGASQIAVTLNQSGVAVTGNTFSTLPSIAYFIGDGSYDPQPIQNNNSFPQNDEIYISQNGVRQDGVYTSIQAAINAAVAGDTVFVGNGTYSGFSLVNGVNVEGQSQTGVIIDGTITTPENFDNTTVSNMTVNDNSPTAMLLDMTQTQEVTSSTFSNVTFNLKSDSSAAVLIGNGQVAGSMALQGSGLTFANVTMNSNDYNFANSTAFAYTLFHSVNGAQLVLNHVSLNGTASGTSSGLGAQWNMSPNGGETADVTIENSSTSGGGNFYVSGMANATITNNVFDGQGVALNGVANGTVTGNTFENIDGAFTSNGTQHRGLTIENAWGATGDSNITVENNTFQNITASDGAIAFQRWTDSNGNLIDATSATLNGINIQDNSFTGVNTPIFLNASSFGVGSVLPATINVSQLLVGTANNDTLTVPPSGNADIFGNGGLDTVTGFGSGYSISINNGHWVVSNGTTTDTLTGIDDVVINGTTYELVDQFGTNGGFQSVQSAVNAAVAGDTILIAPGTYTGATISEALTIQGWGSSQMIVDGGAGGNGLDLTGDFGASSTVSISNIGFTGNQDGIDVHSSTELTNLIVNDDDFKDNIISGVGMGSGAPSLANITIENSTFEQNGNGSENGDGDISLFGFLGNATLENLVINGGTNTVPATSNADFGIQVSGFNPSTHNVTEPIGTVVFNNVQVDGTYDKVAVFVQGYQNLDGLSFQNTGNGGTVINGNDEWGEGLYLDPTADMTPVATIPVNGTNDFLTTGAGADSINLSNVSVTNGYVPVAGAPVDTVIKATPESDTIVGPTGGNNVITGDGGIDTLKVAAGYSISINSGHWVVSNGTTTDTLSGIDQVVIGTQTYELVDKFGPNGGFQSLQTAIDNSSSGATILVAPGTYTESADYNPNTNTDDPNFTNPVGLLVDKSITIEGVDASGNVITSAANTKATIVSSVQSDWGTNFYITAAGVTISGLTLQATDNTYVGPGPLQNQGIVNKAVEDVANDFTLENSVVDAANGVPLGSSVYIDDPNATTSPSFVSSITQYNVTRNVLDGDFVESSGVGFGDNPAGLSLNLTNNEFSLNPGTTADTYAQEDGGFANDSVILNGNLYPEVGWDLASVATPTITGNTVDANYTESPTGSRFFAADNSAANLPGLSFVQDYIANNNLGNYAYVLTASGALEIPTFGGYSSYEIYLNVGDATAPATADGPDGTNAGDKVIVQSGSDSSVQTVGTNNLTIEALSGSTSLHLSLGSGVSSITLADYSTGHGANVTVTGTNSGDIITGNDGNDTLTGGTGSDTFNVGSGNSTVTGGGGTDTVNYDAALSAADFSIVGGQWQVSDGSHGTDTLSGIAQVTDGTHTFLLVGDGGYASIQAAVNAASAGDTILIAPGTYAGATISEALTIIGSGVGQTIINAGPNADGLDITGSIGGSATVSISNIEFSGNQDGIDVRSSTVLGNLNINDADFEHNTISGVGMGSGAPNLSNISITNSTFTQNGNGSENGDGDISLFGFLGNATLENLIINGGTNGTPTTSNADYGIQISGFDPTTHNVTQPIGTVVFNNVQVNGSYDKVSVYIQGYTNLDDLDFANTGSGGTVISGHDGWGYGLYFDPTSGETPVSTIPQNGTNDFQTSGAGSESVNLTNVSISNNINSFTGAPLGTVFNGTPENDTISGLSGGNNYINGAGGIDTVDFTETLSVSNFQMVGGNWVVTTSTEGTDTLPAVELVNDGGGHTFLLVGGGSTYASPNAAFTSAQYSTGDIIVDTAAQDETPSLTVNNGGQFVGAAGSGSVAFSVTSLDDDESGTLTFNDGSGHTLTLQVVEGAALSNRFQLNGAPVSTVNLSNFNDGTITATLSVIDTAGNSDILTNTSVTLDQDLNEHPSVSVDNGASTPIGSPSSTGVRSTAVAFAVNGMESDDSGTLTFKDSSNNTVVVTITNGAVVAGPHNTATTVNLSSLGDGTITSALSLSDTAGNSFSAAGNQATLDQDTSESLSVSVDSGSSTPIGGPSSSLVQCTAVAFAINGMESDDSGTLTFKDSGTNTVVVTITNGAVVAGAHNTATTVNLSLLVDGSIMSSLSLADTAGNSFSATGNQVTLDQDTGEQVSLTLTVGNTDVGTATEMVVPFSVGGLESDDSGTVTFSNGAHSITVSIAGGQVVAGPNNTATTVNLSSLPDGTITSSLVLNTDPAGNTFTAVAGNSITLDTVQPTLTTPTIVGTAQEGKTLTAASNAGQSDDTLSFSWYSSADNFTTAVGTGSTYLLKQTDEGRTIEVKATASNPNGSTTLASAATGTVIAAFPTVTPASPSVPASASETFTASQLFSASDPDGTPVSFYEVEDTTTGSSQGFWTLNGVVQANGTPFTVTAAQLSGLSFTAGSNTSLVTDTLEVAAADAAGLGSFATFTVNASGHVNSTPPTVSASNETVLPESNLAASSMFSGTAFGNLSIQSYEVEDTTSNSGSWILNGVVEPANQVIDVTAAQLSALSFQTGFGTDTLMVRANDGTQWGNYTTFTISPKANAAPPAGTTTVLDLEKPATGVYEYYDIGKNGILQAGPLDQISTSLKVVGIGGFNGSDTADLLTRNTATGAFTIYDVSNNNVTGSTPMGQVGLEWQVAGFGDFSTTAGETDMLMRNTNGQFEVYDIRNNGITGAASMGQVGTEWQVAGFGDFSTTAGETDMLMRNTNTGQFELYDISHNQLVGAASMGQVGLEWQVLGFGDFSGNANETDMLMQNKNSGAFEVYDIRDNQIVGAASMGQVGLQWTVAGFADFSGNANETDLLMRNSASGAFELYDIKGNTITSASGVGSVGTEWQVTGVAVDPPPGSSSAAASTVLSGPTDDPAGGNSISQLTQAMASIAAPGGTSSATAPLGQSPMPGADILATTMQNNPHA